MLLWGSLPVALTIALSALDAITLTFIRFAFATVALGLWLGLRGQLSGLAGLSSKTWIAVGLAGLFLIGNYVFYLLGLARTSPANAQLLIQSAPLLMALGGIFVFHERYNRWQWFGFALTIAGLLLFFYDQQQRSSATGYGWGAALIVLAAAVWAAYALIQKQLLLKLSSAVVLWLIYVLATVLLAPFANFAPLAEMGYWPWFCLIYAALNTLLAYGAFAEALAHWEASRVSAVLALSPLCAVGFMGVLAPTFPQYLSAETISVLGYGGALTVIAGAMLSSLAGQRRPPAVTADADRP